MSVDDPTCLSPTLVARFAGTAPSYATYPDAAQFHEGFDSAKLKALVLDSNDEPIPRSLSLVVHLPLQCQSGRDSHSPHTEPSLQHYMLCLAREIELLSPWFDRDREVLRLHIVGGMLNGLAQQALPELLDTLQRQFTFAHARRVEIGIEVDPGSTHVAALHNLVEMGFNHISFAEQDVACASSTAIGVAPSIERTRCLIEAARELGLRSFNVALSLGLTQQSLAYFLQTLQQVIELQPQRIVINEHARALKPATMPSHYARPNVSLRLSQYAQALTQLDVAGYQWMGMDQFGRRVDRLAQQQHDDEHAASCPCDVIGLGLGGISRIGDSYSQNEVELSAYVSTLDNATLPVTRGFVLEEDDVIRHHLINALICYGSIDTALFAQRHQLDFRVYFARSLDALQPYLNEGLVRYHKDIIEVSAHGRLVLRYIAMCFDAYARPQELARQPQRN